MAPAGPHGSWEILRRNGLKNKGNMLKKRVKFDDGKIGKEVNLMPGFDRSGPMGTGPMTGGRRGICGNRAGAANMQTFGGGYGSGRGMGFRRGFGRGRGRGFGPGYGPPAYSAGYPAAASKAGELEMLRADAETMQKSLEAIQRRIAELDKEDTQ